MNNLTLVNKTICLCAKRNSGKSQLLRYLVLQQRSLFKTIFLISPTEEINSFYSDVVKKENIFSKYNEDWIEKLMIQMAKTNANKNEEQSSQILLILDDVCSDTNFHQSKTFKKLFTRGRHLKIGIIITAQYPYHIPPICRSNCDFILCSQLNRQGIEILTSEFLMGKITKSEFIEMYYRNTADFGFLVINNNCASSNENLDLIYGNLKVPEKFIK